MLAHVYAIIRPAAIVCRGEEDSFVKAVRCLWWRTQGFDARGIAMDNGQQRVRQILPSRLKARCDVVVSAYLLLVMVSSFRQTSYQYLQLVVRQLVGKVRVHR